MTTIFILRSVLLLLATFTYFCYAETLDTTESHAEEEEEKRQNIAFGTEAALSSFLPSEGTTKPNRIEKLNTIWSPISNSNDSFSEYDELHGDVKPDASPENSVDKDSLENVNYFLKENPDIENTTFLDLKRIPTTTTTTQPLVPEFREEDDEPTSMEVPSHKDSDLGSNCADGNCKLEDEVVDSKEVPTSPPTTISLPLWNKVKPLERSSSEASSSTYTPFVEYVNSVTATMSSTVSTSAQTSDNIIILEETELTKDDSVIPNQDKVKPGKMDTTPDDLPSESTLLKVTAAPTATYPKETSSFTPDFSLFSSFLFTKILNVSPTVPSPTSVETPLLIVSSSVPVESKPVISSDFIVEDKPPFVNIPSVEFSKEVIDFTTPLSTVIPTGIKLDVKSVDFPIDLKPTKAHSEKLPNTTPVVFPSIEKSTSSVMISSSVVNSESILPSFSTVLDESTFQMISPTVTVTTPLETESPSSPVVPVVQESTGPKQEKAAPPPRLSNPSCSSLPVCIGITLLDTSWEEFCGQLADFRDFMSKSVSRYTRPVYAHHIVVDEGEACARRPLPHQATPDVSLDFYVIDDSGEYEERLTEICGFVLRKWAPTAFRSSVMEVRLYSSEAQSTPLPLIPELNSGFVAAVSISAVAGVALCLLCILLVVMKQKMMQGRNSDTTTPTADAYSLDSLSINASFRRRRTRRSGRSYLNHAFSDQEIPSHPVNEKTLVNCLKSRDLLEEEFKKIPLNMPKLDAIPEGAHVKNRYSNILPRPESRVLLAEPTGDPLKCYINANFVKGYEGKSAFYIACQAPLPEGIEDFWRMVWEQQSRCIVMLTQFEENGTSRCAMYFPQSTLVSQSPYGDFQVSLLKKDVYEFYTMSTMRLLDLEKNLFRDIVHLWFTGWPDVGVPKDPSSLITFVQQCRPYINCNSGPTVIHCSTGTGRTGVFLALDICMREYEESRSIDILQCVSQLRRDRGGAVQNKDQYILIYDAMLEYITRVANQSEFPSLHNKNS